MVFRGHFSKTSGFFVYFAAASHEHRPQGRGNSALLNVTTWPSHKNKTAAQSSYDDFSAAIYWMGLSHQTGLTRQGSPEGSPDTGVVTFGFLIKSERSYSARPHMEHKLERNIAYLRTKQRQHLRAPTVGETYNTHIENWKVGATVGSGQTPCRCICYNILQTCTPMQY